MRLTLATLATTALLGGTSYAADPYPHRDELEGAYTRCLEDSLQGLALQSNDAAAAVASASMLACDAFDTPYMAMFRADGHRDLEKTLMDFHAGLVPGLSGMVVRIRTGMRVRPAAPVQHAARPVADPNAF